MSYIQRFLIALVVLFSAVVFRMVTYDEFKLLRNELIRLEATVKREPRIFESNQLVYIGDAKIYTDLYPRIRVGERISVEGQIDDRGRMFGAKVGKIGYSAGISTWRFELRGKIATNIQSILPPKEATLVLGTVLGLDTISENFREQLVETGTLHVVVVSGQNMMIVSGIFMALAKYIGRRKSLILSLFAISIYAFIAGFEPPVLRAGLMAAFASLALFFGRENNPILSLVLAALMILLVWPKALFEVSFQLTFAATIGIITLGKYLQEKLRRLDFIGQNAAISTSAYVFTAPLIFWHFSQVTPIAPVANLLVSEAVFPIMVLGFLTAIFSLIWLPLASIFGYAAYIFAFYFVKVVELLSGYGI